MYTKRKWVTTGLDGSLTVQLDEAQLEEGGCIDETIDVEAFIVEVFTALVEGWDKGRLPVLARTSDTLIEIQGLMVEEFEYPAEFGYDPLLTRLDEVVV